MKKSGLVFMVTSIFLICLALPALADDKQGTYIGLGGNYALQSFQTVGNNSFDNAAGFNVKVGYKQSKESATELALDYFPEFKWTHFRDFLTPASGMTSEKVRVFSVMVAQKFSLPYESFRPFVIGGIGYMSAKSESGSTLGSPDSTGFNFKAGLGMDYFVTGNISLGLEGSYVFGTGDVRYANFTGGAAYHF